MTKLGTSARRSRHVPRIVHSYYFLYFLVVQGLLLKHTSASVGVDRGFLSLSSTRRQLQDNNNTNLPTNGDADATASCCIDRKSVKLKAILYGNEDDLQWQGMVAAMHQSASDLQVHLAHSFHSDLDKMSSELKSLLSMELSDQDIDGLIVNMPTQNIQDDVRSILQETNIVVIGLDSMESYLHGSGAAAFIDQDDYEVGRLVARELIRQYEEQLLSTNNQGTAPSLGGGITVIYDERSATHTSTSRRLDGFEDAIILEFGSIVSLEEVIVEDYDNMADTVDNISEGFEDCRQRIVLIASVDLVPSTLAALDAHGCLSSSPSLGSNSTGKTLVGAFDFSRDIQYELTKGNIEIAVLPPTYVKGALSVVMAALKATTGINLSISALDPEGPGLYLASPNIVTQDTVLSAHFQQCTQEAFPRCNTECSASSANKCECTDRTQIRLAGVTHGEETDGFWRELFAGAQQAGMDLGISLDLEPLHSNPDGEEDSSIIYARMAENIESFCLDPGIDGIFVSIPSDTLVEAIEICMKKGVPVISVNSGFELAQSMGLLHHVGMREITAGFEAGRRLMFAARQRYQDGPIIGFCVNRTQQGSLFSNQHCDGFRDFFGKNSSDTIYGGSINMGPDPATYSRQVESAIRIRLSKEGVVNDNWPGVVLLTVGEEQTSFALSLSKGHSHLTVGSFDRSSLDLQAGLEFGLVEFGIDDQPYLQGYWPVALLTYNSYAKQKLTNFFIETGPIFVGSPSSMERQECRQNLFSVCADDCKRGQSSGGGLHVQKLIVAIAIVVGIVFGLVCFLMYRIGKLNEQVIDMQDRGVRVPRLTVKRRVSSFFSSIDEVLEGASRDSLKSSYEFEEKKVAKIVAAASAIRALEEMTVDLGGSIGLSRDRIWETSQNSAVSGVISSTNEVENGEGGISESDNVDGQGGLSTAGRTVEEGTAHEGQTGSATKAERGTLSQEEKHHDGEKSFPSPAFVKAPYDLCKQMASSASDESDVELVSMKDSGDGGVPEAAPTNGTESKG